MITSIVLVAFTLLIFGILILMVIHGEKKEYNKGICPVCNEKLTYFTEDSQGGRGYICPDCCYITWCSWSCVDKGGV